MKPGATTSPSASITRAAPPETGPISAIRPPAIDTSARRAGAPVPSIRVPFLIRRSLAIGEPTFGRVVRLALRDAVRVGDVEEVDVTDLLDEAFRVGIGEADLVDPLHLGRDVLAVGARRTVARLVRRALAVVALDDEAGGGVDHVEIADVVAVRLQQVLPGSPGPLALRHVEFEDAEKLAPVLRLPPLLGLDPQRTFEERVQEPAVRGCRHPFVASRAAHRRREVPRHRRRRHRVEVRSGALLRQILQQPDGHLKPDVIRSCPPTVPAGAGSWRRPARGSPGRRSRRIALAGDMMNL